jgi:hypothetical protein
MTDATITATITADGVLELWLASLYFRAQTDDPNLTAAWQALGDWCQAQRRDALTSPAGDWAPPENAAALATLVKELRFADATLEVVRAAVIRYLEQTGAPPPSTGPQFTHAPTAGAVSPDGATIAWQTDVPTTAAILAWQETDPTQRGTWGHATATLEHAQRIGPCRPGTRYLVEITARTSTQSTTARTAFTTTTVAPPTGADLPHQTDFLAAGVRTHPYAGYPPEHRQQILRAMTSRQYTHLYVYAYNERDYGGPSVDGLRNPQEFRARLEEIRAAGLKAVVWLFPDDAPTIHGTAETTLRSLLSGFVPVVDDLVSSYVLGLELNEYWDASRVERLGTHLNTLTQKPLASHMTSGEWSYARQGWVDYHVHQYSNRTVAGMGSETRAVKSGLGKPVVAGEYEVDDEAKAVQLGNAAMAAGADGFGNGGTPVRVAQPPPVGADDPIPHPPIEVDLLAEKRPWVAGTLTTIDPTWADWLARYCRGGKTHLVIANMDQTCGQERLAGFQGRDNALWYTLSRSYAEWPWQLRDGDPDAHLSTQRREIHDFWWKYLDAIGKAMQAAPSTTALFLRNDGHDKCGDVLSQYSLQQLDGVASRVERGDVYHG